MSDTRLLGQELSRLGARDIFGIPGEGPSLELIDELERCGAKFHSVCHEAVAALMAGGFARATGMPGICLSIKGPGFANMLAGIASNWLDRNPVLSLSESYAPGTSSDRMHKRLAHREMVKPVIKAYADNFAYNVSYTLSHSKDDASSPGATESEANIPQNVRNIFDETGEWALSSFDHRHQFIASGVYEFPFFSGAGGVREAVLGGWRVNAIFIAQAGAPFTVNLSVDRANIGAGPAQRPDQLRASNLPGGERTPERWFDTSAFALPAAFTFGSAPRNSVIGPGYANMDFALAKTWAFGRSQLEFRWEVFNLLNRANFDLPSRIFGNTNFGRIFSAKSPREMQFGLRFAF
jgi:hypothetical protein